MKSPYTSSLLIVLLFTSLSHAAPNTNAVTLQETRSTTIANPKNELLLNFSELQLQQSEYSSTVGANIGWNVGINDVLQMTFRAGFTDYSAKNNRPTSYQNMGIGAGPTFNFGTTQLESNYFLGLVYEYNTKKYDQDYYVDRESYLSLEFGKRFVLTQSFTYRPYFKFANEVADSDGEVESPTYTLNFLAFSYLF